MHIDQGRIRSALQWVSVMALGNLLASPTALAAQHPTGWVQSGTYSMETYIYPDGSRWEGDRRGTGITGKGTLHFVNIDGGPTGYANSSDPTQIRGGQLIAQFEDGRPVANSEVTFRSRWKDPNQLPVPGAFLYVGGWQNGANGPGRVTFRDGRKFTGQFANESTLYVDVLDDGRIVYRRSNWVGSYFEGDGVMTYPDGSVFEGKTLRYYLFDRGELFNTPCASSVLYGKGILKVPGKPDYVGLVGEDYDTHKPAPISAKTFTDYAEYLAKCPRDLAADANDTQASVAAYEAEMAEGRANAQAILAANLSNLANQVSQDMARVDAASRGTSYEIEQAKRQRNADYAQFLSEQPPKPAQRPGKEPRQPSAASNPPPSAIQVSKRAAATSDEPTADTPGDQQAAADAVASENAKAARLEHEASVKRTLDEIERKRAATAEAAKHKAEKDNEERQLAQRKTQYLAQIRDKTQLAARTCPGGEGKYYVVGLKPAIKPEVVECLDVSYTASCPGSRQTSSGVIKTFLGASTDCYLGDTAEIAPQLDCKASEVKVTVRQVTECK